MKTFDLQLHTDPAYTITIYKDANVTIATPSADAGDKDDEITMTLVFAAGYELDECEVIAGGVTYNPTTKKFVVGQANVVLYFKSKKNNLYKVTENATVVLNGAKTELAKNTVLELTPNGAIKGVTCAGTEVTVNGAMDGLIEQGVLIKM